jgi:elongation factor P--(R)-beta-lysine ligase
MLRRRAEVLTQIRAYFSSHGVLEVDTPTLGYAGASDPALTNLTVIVTGAPPRYLQTSPEFAMKRLLAAGSGDIYQVCHAYRAETPSPLHVDEFTLLEWYRIGFDHHQLMDDVAALLAALGFARQIERHSFQELCARISGFDPHRISTEDLAAYARAGGARFAAADYADRALLLDYVFGAVILAQIPRPNAFFIYDFPVEHAAYARIHGEDPPLAARFELVIDGIEIANGFHEVVEADQQRARQVRENARRRAYGLPESALDEALLAALASGLPPCAGVAVGVDRLLMVLTERPHIAQVVAFAHS